MSPRALRRSPGARSAPSTASNCSPRRFPACSKPPAAGGNRVLALTAERATSKSGNRILENSAQERDRGDGLRFVSKAERHCGAGAAARLVSGGVKRAEALCWVRARIAVACPLRAWAGAWTLPEGTGQWLATLTASTSTRLFRRATGSLSTPRYSKRELQRLIEYGLTDRLTAIFDPGLQHIDIAAPTNAAAHRPRLHRVRRALRIFRESRTGCCPARRRCAYPAPPTRRIPAAIGYTDVEADFRALLGHNFKLG